MEVSESERVQQPLKPHSLTKLADEFVRSDARYGTHSGATHARWTTVLAWIPETRTMGILGDYTDVYAKAASSRNTHRVFAAMELAELQYNFYNFLYQNDLTFRHVAYANYLLVQQWHIRLNHTFFHIVDEKRRMDKVVLQAPDPIRLHYH